MNLDPARITALRAQGLTWQRIAAELGCSTVTLLTVRKRVGLPCDHAARVPRLSPDTRSLRQREVEQVCGRPLPELFRELDRTGVSQTVVADLLGVDWHTAAAWRKSLGIPAPARRRRRA